MFRTFIMSMLSGERGPSSKRGVMVWLLMLFTILIIVNLLTGKQLAQMYSEQLFELLLVAMGIVFGEKFVTALSTARQKSTTKTTVVAPADATVVNTTETKEPVKP